MRSEMTVHLWIVIDHLFSFLLLASQIRAAAGHVRGQLDQRFLREPARRDAAGGDQEEAGSILRRGICPAEEDSGGVNNRMYSAHLYICMYDNISLLSLFANAYQRLKTEYWVGLFDRKVQEDNLKRAEAAAAAPAAP